ncbi:MAG: hypothetical protein U0Q12_02240 [Vicinamibacterales bacterium]
MRLLLWSPTKSRLFESNASACVCLIHVVRARAERAPLLDELAVLRELHDPGIGAAVTFGDEDLTGIVRDDVVRLEERVLVGRLVGLVASGLPRVIRSLPSELN